MREILSSPLFGITLSIVAFKVGLSINEKVKHPLANPLIIALIIIVATLKLFGIPHEYFEAGSSIILLFLAPVTAVLGTLAGSAAAIGSVVLLSRLMGLHEAVTASLIPKSVTTPVAIALAEQMGGISALTIASTIISGLAGNLFAPLLITLFAVKDPVAQGVAIGCASHALGTSKAMEIGQVQGAMSSISISLSAIWTVLLVTLFF